MHQVQNVNETIVKIIGIITEANTASVLTSYNYCLKCQRKQTKLCRVVTNNKIFELVILTT